MLSCLNEDLANVQWSLKISLHCYKKKKKRIKDKTYSHRSSDTLIKKKIQYIMNAVPLYYKVLVCIAEGG